MPKPRKAIKPRLRIGPRKKKIAELRGRLKQLQGRKRYLEGELKKLQHDYGLIEDVFYFGGPKVADAEKVKEAKKGNTWLDACTREIEGTTKFLKEYEWEISRINSQIAEMEKRRKWPLVTWRG